MTSPDELRLKVLLAPLIALANSHTTHLETHTRSMNISPEQQAHLDEIKAALKKLSHHGAQLGVLPRR
jgi:hypothetical protein